MLQLIAGMAIGWLAFTDEGKKVAGQLSKKMMSEATKSLRDMGVLEDDDKSQDSPSSPASV